MRRGSKSWRPEDEELALETGVGESPAVGGGGEGCNGARATGTGVLGILNIPSSTPSSSSPYAVAPEVPSTLLLSLAVCLGFNTKPQSSSLTPSPASYPYISAPEPKPKSSPCNQSLNACLSKTLTTTTATKTRAMVVWRRVRSRASRWRRRRRVELVVTRVRAWVVVGAETTRRVRAWV